MNNKTLDKILNEVSLDQRVTDGIFRIENNDHMEVFREYFITRGIDESLVCEFSNRVLEGKYPERQAYNAKGILVTFPTPEYKADAIKRGTHFEENPVKNQSNLFSEPSSSPTPAPKGSSDTKSEEPKTSQPKTNLPVSQASTTPASSDTESPEQIQAQTTAAPQQTPVSTQPAEPVEEPTTLPDPPEKSSAEKEADKNAIKQMLKGDDYMLEEVAEFIRYNAPHIMETIKKKLNYEL